jgi:hypothetical protein
MHVHHEDGRGGGASGVLSPGGERVLHGHREQRGRERRAGMVRGLECLGFSVCYDMRVSTSLSVEVEGFS